MVLAISLMGHDEERSTELKHKHVRKSIFETVYYHKNEQKLKHFILSNKDISGALWSKLRPLKLVFRAIQVKGVLEVNEMSKTISKIFEIPEKFENFVKLMGLLSVNEEDKKELLDKDLNQDIGKFYLYFDELVELIVRVSMLIFTKSENLEAFYTSSLCTGGDNDAIEEFSAILPSMLDKFCNHFS